jgi:hypothetical protein
VKQTGAGNDSCCNSCCHGVCFSITAHTAHSSAVGVLYAA